MGCGDPVQINDNNTPQRLYLQQPGKRNLRRAGNDPIHPIAPPMSPAPTERPLIIASAWLRAMAACEAGFQGGTD